MKIRVSLLAMLLASSGFAFDWSAWEGKVALITAADGEVVVTDTTLAAALKATGFDIAENAVLTFSNTKTAGAPTISQPITGKGVFRTSDSYGITLSADNSAFEGSFEFLKSAVRVGHLKALGGRPVTLDFTSANSLPSFITYRYLQFNQAGTYLASDYTVRVANQNRAFYFSNANAVVPGTIVSGEGLSLRGPGTYSGDLTCKVDGKSFYMGDGVRFAGGTIDLHNSSGRFYAEDMTAYLGSTLKVGDAQVHRGRIVFTAPNVIETAAMNFRCESSSGTFDLGGNDQRVASYGIINTMKQDVDVFTSSTAPATLTFFKMTADRSFPGNVKGALTIRLAEQSTKTLTLSGTKNDTTGGLVVEAGGITIADTAVFTGLTRLEASGTGVLTVNTDQINPNFVDVYLSGTGKIVIPAGVTLMADHLYIGDDEAKQESGTYTKADFPEYIGGEGAIHVLNSKIIVVGGTYHWTGAAGTSLTADGNWAEDQAPDLTSGGDTLDFSTGTATAQVSGDADVMGVTIGRSDGFTLSTDGSGNLMLGEGGLVVTNTTEAAQTVEIASKIQPTVLPQEWRIGADTTVKISGDIWEPFENDHTLTIIGEGASTSKLVLSGDNSSFKSPITVLNLAAVATTPTALGNSNRLFTVTTLGNEKSPRALTFDGGTGCTAFTNAVPVRINGSHADFAADPAMTLVFTECVTYAGGTSSAPCNYQFAGERHFLGGLKGVNVYEDRYFDGPLGMKTYFEGLVDFSGSVLRLVGRGTWYFGTPGTKGTIRLGGDCTVSAVAENALPSFSIGIAQSKSGMVDLNGFNQRVSSIISYNDERGVFCTVKSARPAVLTLQSVGTVDYYKFSGAAGLNVDVGDGGTFTLTNCLSNTCGDLGVTSGTLRMAAGSGWLSASNVTVAAGARLLVDTGAGARAFGPAQGRSKATLTIADGGTLEIAGGERATVRTMRVGARDVGSGEFGGPAAGLDAAHTLDCLAGAGTVYVRGGGLVMIVR